MRDYKEAQQLGDTPRKENALALFRSNEAYFGYGYLDKPEKIIPPVALTFYSFHIMVGLGSWFLVLFFFVLYFSMIGKIATKKLLLYAGLFSIPLGYIAGETGWIVAEVGRQPWAIQGMLPVGMASSHIDAVSVMITLGLFAIIFTALLIAEVKIMLKQITIGPEEA